MINKARLPQRLNIDITPRCNSRCKMCQFWCTYDFEDTSVDLPKEEILRAIAHYDILRSMSSQYAQSFSVNISGGEPLLRFWDVMEIAEFGREIKMKINLLTNGLLINESNYRQLLERDFAYISMSAESDDPVVNDHIRGIEGHCAHIHKILPMMKEYRNERQKRTLFGISIVITKKNLPRLKEISRHYALLGADYVNLQFLDTQRAPGGSFSSDSLYHKALMKYVEENEVPREDHRCIQTQRVPESCGAKNGSFLTVLYNGEISPCAHLRNFPEAAKLMVPMNLKNMTLLEYFREENMKQVNQALSICTESNCSGYHLPCYNYGGGK